MNKYLVVIFVVLMSSLLSMSFLLHVRVSKIKELESSLSSYREVVENNNRTISSLEQDLLYTETLLLTLQRSRIEVDTTHKNVEEEWERVRREHKDESNDVSSVDLREHFRVLKESACSANRNCL